jgi:hypothetical protein
MNLYNNLLLLISIFIFISRTDQKNDYDVLLEWGKNNSLAISDKIEMKYISENNKTYYAKEKILKNEVILIIPDAITLNIKNALRLYGKKGKKLYKEFKSYFDEFKNDFMSDQVFLAYLMYKVNKNDKLKSNNFYKYYQYLFNTYESNLDSFPIFYNRQQLYFIQFTSLMHSIDFIKDIYKVEIDIFENKLKKEIIKDDYYVFRTYSSSKSFNVSGHSVIIPFVDMFNKHPTKYNLKVEATENITRVIATKDILPSEKLYIKYDYLTNHNALTLFGITFDEIIDKVNTMNVPILNPLLLEKNNVDKKDTSYNKYFSRYMDVQKDKFYEKFKEEYKEIAINLKHDESELASYKLILENLETLKEINSKINPSHIYKIFYQQKDIDNILRIFKSEIKVLDKKIELMKKVINSYEQSKQNKKKVNNDL